MTSRPRILVVEDHSPFAEIVSVHLSAAGYDVTIADDGLAALRAFDDISPDLITLDLGVPSVSGFRLLEIFKRNAPTVPVIVATALDFQEAAEVAMSGADDFITKPFDPGRLVQIVEHHLDRRVRRFPITSLSTGNQHAFGNEPGELVAALSGSSSA